MKTLTIALLCLVLLGLPNQPSKAATAESTLDAVTEVLRPQTINPDGANPEQPGPDSAVTPDISEPSSARVEANGATSAPESTSKNTSAASKAQPNGNGAASAQSHSRIFLGYQYLLLRATEQSLLSANIAEQLRQLPLILEQIVLFQPDDELLSQGWEIVWKFSLIILVGGLGFVLTRALWRLACRSLRPHKLYTLRCTPRFGYSHGSPIWLDLIAVLGFVSIGALLIVGLSQTPLESLVLRILVGSVVLIFLVNLVTRMIFSPRSILIERLHLTSASVYRGLHWLNGFVTVALFGFAAIVCLRLLGWPQFLVAILLKLLGLVLLVLTVAQIIAKRRISLDLVPFFSPRGRSEKTTLNEGLIVRVYRSLGKFWWLVAVVYLASFYASWAFNFQGGAETLLKRSGLTLIIILLMQLLINSLLRLRLSTIWLPRKISQYLPQLQARLGKYEPAIRNIVCLVFGGFAALLIAACWGFDSFQWFYLAIVHRVLRSSLEILLVLIVSVLIWEVLGALIEQTLSSRSTASLSDGPSRETSESSAAPAPGGIGVKQFGRLRTLLPLLRNLLFIVLAGFLILTVLAQLGVNIGPLIAGAGFLGIGLGFGAQTVVKDLLNGMFIIIEDSINIGDIIEIGPKMGEVESLTVRTVRLRDGDGTVHTIPFGTVTMISNHSRIFSTHKAEVHIGRTADIDRVCTIMLEVDAELRRDPLYAPLILEPLSIKGIELMNSTQIAILASQNTKKGEQFTVKRHFNLILQKRFYAEKIPPPGQVPVMMVESNTKITE